MSFIREFYIDLLDKTLSFHQKIEGDVSCVVWDASIVLAKYMEERCKKNINFLKNKRVLELGAGLGCVGLTAACLGACVVLTDLHNALPLLELNIKCNRDVLDELNTSIEAKTLQWGQDCDIKFTPDIILLADCIYYEGSIKPLIKTLLDLSGKNTTIILAQELRDSDKQRAHWKYFLENIQTHYKLYFVPQSEQNPQYSSPDIVLIEMRKL